MVDTSKYVEYMGTAACDKDNNSRKLYVYCQELLPLCVGNVKGTTITANVQLKKEGKVVYAGSVDTTNWIECDYYSDTESRSAYPPSIRAGEHVKVINFGEPDHYYWSSTGRTQSNRRTESYRLHVSDTLKNDAELDDTNTYGIDFDTREAQKITIYTANSNGEPFTYKIEVNAKEGLILIGDDNSTQIVLDSNAHSVTMSNIEGSMLQVSKSDINLNCVKDTNLVIGGNLNITVDGSVNIKSKSDIAVSSEGPTVIKTSKKNQPSSSITVSTANIAIKSTSVDISG
jgi:hypothetical protein